MMPQKEKRFAAAVSIVSNSVIIVLKLVAGVLSGSISIISEAVHSLSDLLASVLAFFSVIKSGKPPDYDHPFGHGKYEDMSGFIEGLLIILAAAYIFFEAGKKIILGSHVTIDTTLGIYVMTFAVIANCIVSFYLFRVAKKHDSIALYADAEHLRTDVYSSLAVLGGLIAIKISGIHILDPLFAFVVALLIVRAGYKICKSSLNNLLDGALPSSDMKIIESTVENIEGVLCYKNLKTRKVGAQRNIELTILFPKNMTIYDAHTVCDKIELLLERNLGKTVVLIHAEPECIDCKKKKGKGCVKKC